jgi:uncharacterized protein (DUF305 family)
MPTRWQLAIGLILLLMLVVAGSRQRPYWLGRSGTVGPGWAELTESMARMHAAMSSVRPSGHSDADFVRLMLPHHQAAIDMAKAELLFGDDPQMLRLAEEIIADQQSEIELMHLWLKRHTDR